MLRLVKKKSSGRFGGQQANTCEVQIFVFSLLEGQKMTPGSDGPLQYPAPQRFSLPAHPSGLYKEDTAIFQWLVREEPHPNSKARKKDPLANSLGQAVSPGEPSSLINQKCCKCAGGWTLEMPSLAGDTPHVPAHPRAGVPYGRAREYHTEP